MINYEDAVKKGTVLFVSAGVYAFLSIIKTRGERLLTIELENNYNSDRIKTLEKKLVKVEERQFKAQNVESIASRRQWDSESDEEID